MCETGRTTSFFIRGLNKQLYGQCHFFFQNTDSLTIFSLNISRSFYGLIVDSSVYVNLKSDVFLCLI